MLALIQTIAFSKAPHQQKASQRLNSSPVRSLVIELWTGCIIFLQWTGKVFIWEAFHINDSGELFSFPQIGWYATSKHSLWKTLEHHVFPAGISCSKRSAFFILIYSCFTLFQSAALTSNATRGSNSPNVNFDYQKLQIHIACSNINRDVLS